MVRVPRYICLVLLDHPVYRYFETLISFTYIYMLDKHSPFLLQNFVNLSLISALVLVYYRKQ